MALISTPVPANTPVGDVSNGKFLSFEAIDILLALATLTAANRIFAITPSDSADVSPLPLALKVTVAGNLALKGTDAAAVVIPVVVGETVALRARRVMATGTTATVVGLA